MTITIDEYSNSIGGFGNTSFALSGLVSSDVIVGMVTANSNQPTISTTISGLTLTDVFDFTQGGGKRVRIWWGTSATGSSGNVQMNNNSVFGARAQLFVIHGLTSSTYAGSQKTAFDSNSTTANVEEVTSSISFGVGQVAVAVGVNSAGNITFPSTSMSPAAGGWTVDDGPTDGWKVAHRIAESGDTTAVAAVKADTGTYVDCAVLVFGAASGGGGPSPLVSTFVGWGNPIF